MANRCNFCDRDIPADEFVYLVLDDTFMEKWACMPCLEAAQEGSYMAAQRDTNYAEYLKDKSNDDA